MKTETQSKERAELIFLWQNWFGKLEQLDGTYARDAAERVQAFGKFLQIGFPTTSLEEWKYTPVLPLLRKESTPALVPVRPSLSLRQLNGILPKKFKTNRLVFVNGWYAVSF